MKLACLILLASAIGIQAATNTAASMSAADVQSAINASSDGDTVVCPAGSATWNTIVTCNKGIAIVGQGTNSSIIIAGQTHIFDASGLGNKKLHVTGFKWDASGVNNSGSLTVGLITIDGLAWRFSTNLFIHPNDNVFEVSYGTGNGGLIDHCVSYSHGSSQAINFLAGFGVTNVWSTNISTVFGTTNETYIENCAADWDHFADNWIDPYGGFVYCARYNSITNTAIGNHGADTGGYRSVWGCEIYMNYFKNTGGGSLGYVINSRGGTFYVWSNTIVGNWNVALELDNFRANGQAPCFPADCTPWGTATGSNPYDGNQDGTGWPTLDQIGETGPTTFTGSNSTQTRLKTCYYSNLVSGASFSFGEVGTDSPTTVKGSRDWTNVAPSILGLSYTPLVYPHPLVTGGGGGDGGGSAVSKSSVGGATIGGGTW